MRRQCTAIKSNGQPCQSYTVEGSDLCYFHSPTMAAKRAEARHRGGVNRRAPKNAAHGPYAIKTVADIMQALEDALNDACGLENSHARARTIGYLCQISLKALEIGELEERVKALEERVSI